VRIGSLGPVPRRSEPYRSDAPIVPELAAGAVLMHETQGDVLLLHQRDEDRWCFPKGHVDSGESLSAAAVREIREETGLSSVTLDEELGEVSYRFYQPKKARNVHKTTVYFLAHTSERSVRPEPIFDRHEWVSVATARERVTYETDRQVLELLSRRLSKHRPG
jgi:8-oxo-dGTP pyrophosphatase MutT (NUDIX family)